MRGRNSDDIQRYNRALVLEYIRKHPHISRTELASLCALTQTTISNIVGELMGYGIVEETGALTGGGGRKPIGLQIAGESHLVACCHIGPQTIRCTVFDLSGSAVHHERLFYESPGQLPEIVAAWVSMQREHAPAKRFLGMGVALSPALAAEDAPLKSLQRDLTQALQLPVQMLADTAASAYAHWVEMPDTDRDRSVVYISAGERITSATVAAGRILPSGTGAVGELGHVSINFNGPVCDCGGRGCANLYASLPALRADLEHKRELFPNSPVPAQSSGKTIATHYHKGDELTTAAVDTAGHFLGMALSAPLRLLKPDTIVIGGELAACGNGYLAAVHQIVSRYTGAETAQHTRILLEKQGGDSALTGMYYCVMRDAVNNIDLFHKTTATEKRNA